ncbi:MAG: hypothetical protein HGA45_10110 [Chloroflexales bacterium]|nr:hypothetical protein [Chloroflexales bacterium]
MSSPLIRWQRTASGVLVVIVMLSLIALLPARAQPQAAPQSLTLAPDGLRRLVDSAISGGQAPTVAGAYNYSASRPLPPQMLPPSDDATISSSLDDGYTPEQDAIINWVNQNSLNFPYQPNSAADPETIRAWAETNAQIQRAAEAQALIALQQSDSVLNYGRDVLAAGGDPNVFFAQNPLPSTFSAEFNNLLNPGYSFNALDPIGTTLNTINLSFARLSIYPTPFLTSLNRSLFAPTSSASAINFNQAEPPGSCSIGNPLLPTTITFNHMGSRPVIVSQMNYLCQEVFYTILLPHTFYTQFTYAGETWRFRDGLTGAPILGEPEFVIPAQTPQIYTIFDTPLSQQATATLSGAVTQPDDVEHPLAQQTTQDGLDGLTARYAALSQMQLGNFYGDPEVARLRAELSQQILLRLQTDPLYIYWSQELKLAREEIRQAQPSYARVVELSAQIDSWTAPADAAAQRERFAIRQEFLRLQARLEQEQAAFLNRNPELKHHLAELENWLSSRVDLLQSDTNFLRWHAEWARRWEREYAVSDQGMTTALMARELVEDFPTFTRYQQVRRELVDLLPGLDDSPPVQRFTQIKDAVANDTAADEQVRQNYEQYLTQVEQTLGTTEAPVILERFYNLLNGLIKGDATFRRLEQQNQSVIGALEARQRLIHAAVASCFERDSDCDPYGDREVTDQLYSSEARQLIADASSFYEQYNSFWYNFYTSQSYLDLENETKAALSAPMSSVQSALTAAKEQYDSDLAAIPQLRRLRTASNTMLADLCPATPSLSSAPISDPTDAVCAHLAELRQLDRRLGELAHLTEGGEQLFLPRLAR